MSFVVERKNENGFNKIILKDTVNNTSAEIIPDCGGILHSFNILDNNISKNIIDNYDSYADFVENVATKGFKSCKLSPFACRIKNAQYHFGNQQYTIQKFLLGKNALHGLLYNATFCVIQTLTDSNEANIILQHRYNGSDLGYPFPFICNVKYQLKKNNTLSITTEIINTHYAPIPIQDGWHPYFTFHKKIDELQLSFNSIEKFLFDNDMLPTEKKQPYQQFNTPQKIGNTHFDDCFKLNSDNKKPACVISDEKIKIEVYADNNYPYLQIYTPDHRNSIAIENLSAIPDCFNNGIGLITLKPNQQESFSVTYKVELLT